MNIEPSQQQAYLGEVAQHATASTPLMRFVPAAAAVSDQTVDQWVEQELQRGRSRVRAGLPCWPFSRWWRSRWSCS